MNVSRKEMQGETSISSLENLAVPEPPPLFAGDYDSAASFYTSIFSPKHFPLLDYMNAGSSSFFPSMGSDDVRASFLHHIQQQLHQDLMDSHHRVLLYLHDMAKQAQALRQENVNLKVANLELTNRLSMMLTVTQFPGMDLSPHLDSVADVLQQMGISTEEEGEGTSQNEAMVKSPTSVMDSGLSGPGGPEQVHLPKTISVRSSGYLKAIRAGRSRGEGGDWVQASNQNEVDTGKQKVYIKGSKKEQPVELEVYSQGMFKTELCNKWQQTGACPYGDNCQFAHGINELRPVLRHPRYKTEVCHMVLNGVPCPYGHRCHFRHTLTDQEKLVRAQMVTLSSQ